MKLALRAALVVLLCTPQAVLANEYLSNNPNDWFRYDDSLTGQEVNSEISNVYGSWRLWSDWAGMGPTWVYTSANHDYFWLWNGTTYTLVANLEGQVGETRNLDMPCNQGQVTIAARGSLTTPAGTFNDVVQLDLQTSCADAGTTRIYVAKGVGIVRYEAQNFAGPRVFQLTSAMVNGQLISGAPATSAPAPTTASADPVAPSEHAPMETILWGANDTYLVLETYRDAFRAADGSGAVMDVNVASQSVASQLRYELSQASVPMDDVEIFVVALDSVWMRDYGPIVLKDGSGQRSVADLEYYWSRRQDNAFPEAYASYRGWSRTKVNVGYEGGNYATDGRGLQILSNGVKWFNDDMTTSQIEREFRAKMNTTEFLWVEPLVDEGTTHVDMFLRIMNDDTALVSRYPSSHRQARICNDAAAKLQGMGYQVIRVDADHTYDEFASYTNSVLVNGRALVPMYNSASKNNAALAAYRQAGFQAHGIESKLIIRYSGATHCLSMQIPR